MKLLAHLVVTPGAEPELAAADEERFVDRARSLDFCSHVTWHERNPA